MTTESSGTGDVHRSLALMWQEVEQDRDTDRRRLSVRRIVEAAIAVADAEGLESVSMRRVAAELGVGTMSLYRYVPGKEELLDLMLDSVNREDDLEPFPADWRATLDRFARETWELYRQHPWLPFVDQSRPLLGPNALAGLEALLGGLEGTGLSDQEKILAITTLEGFVASLARTVNGVVLAEQRTGVSTEEFWRAQEPILVRAMDSGRYPRLAGMDEDTFGAGPEESFEFGLTLVLDGLAALLERRGARHTDR
jgi:AcrR family transcriptional regulator